VYASNMKILIFNEMYYPHEIGGAEVSVRLLAEEFVRLGHSVCVVSSCNQDRKDVVNGVVVYYVNANPVYWFGEKRNRTSLKKALWHIVDIDNFFIKSKIDEIVKEVKPDIIHTNNLSHFSCIVWKIAKENDFPVCHTLRDYYLLCLKCSLFKNGVSCKSRCIFCKSTSFFKRIYSNYVGAVVGISNHILQRHLCEKYFPNARYKEVVFNSLIVNKEKSYIEGKKKKNIGYIGSLKDSKGVDKLIKAFIQCDKNDYSLFIAGSGTDDYVNYLKSLCCDNSNIQFLGRVDAQRFYKKIDLLVVPSVWEEPFGRIVIESIATGVPVLASNKGGIPEIVVNRQEARIYDPDDSDALRKELCGYMNGEYQFSFHDVENFINQFDSRVIALKYIDLFNRLKKNRTEP